MNRLSTSLRERSIEETWRLLEPKLEKLGVSRVANITGMDRVGVPVFQAIRPDTRFPNTVFAGKGITDLESKVSACMEALESYASEQEIYLPLRKSMTEMASSGLSHISPQDCCFSLKALSQEQPLDWVSVDALALNSRGRVVGGTKHWVMKEAVAMPCENPVWLCHTNGIASGNSVEEALLHGLFEVIERDAQSIALAARRARKVSSEVLSSNEVSEVLAKIRNSGLKCVLKDITSDIGVPTYYAIVWDPADDSAWYFSGGTGCHFFSRIAAVRALTEALQARASMISGAREDLRHERVREQIGAERLRKVFGFWLSEDGEPAQEIAAPPIEGVTEALKYLTQLLEGKGLKIKWFRYHFDTGSFHVVRAIVPGLESFVVDKARFGARLLAVQPALRRFI